MIPLPPFDLGTILDIQSHLNTVKSLWDALGKPVVELYNEITDPKKLEELGKDLKEFREKFSTLMNIVEEDTETLSIEVLKEKIMEYYSFPKDFSGVAVLKREGNVVAVVLLKNNAPAISVKCPLLLISYKSVDADLEAKFGDKEMLVLN